MKMKALLAVVCFSVIAIFSCEKDKSTVPSGSCSFKFDGTEYITNDARGYVTDTTGVGKKVLTVEGITSNLGKHVAIGVIFPDSLTTGEFNNETAYVLFGEINNEAAAYESSELTVKITSINSKYAEGTFAGILKSGEIEKPLTDGTFKVNIY